MIKQKRVKNDTKPFGVGGSLALVEHIFILFIRLKKRG